MYRTILCSLTVFWFLSLLLFVFWQGGLIGLAAATVALGTEAAKYLEVRKSI